MYVLVGYWVTVLGSITGVLGKMDGGLVERVVGVVVAEYCFTGGRRNGMVVRLLAEYLEQASQ